MGRFASASRSPGRGWTTERGAGLLELVVTATLILGAILLTVGAIDSSARAVVASESGTTALELAESELEALRSVPFADLGLVKNSNGFVESFEGRPTVTVESGPVAPRSKLSVDDKLFQVTRHVTSGGPSQPDGTPALKHVTVLVEWDEDHEVRLDSAVATSCAVTTTTTTTTTTTLPIATVPVPTTTSTTTTTTTRPGRPGRPPGRGPRAAEPAPVTSVPVPSVPGPAPDLPTGPGLPADVAGGSC